MAALTALTACNKDDDIVINNPEKPEATEVFTVMEYLPAPGQFINEKASGFDGEETSTQAAAYAQKRLDEGLYVSLGAWGGYITVKAPARIKAGEGYDFSIAGNSFSTSNEAGIVWVSADVNGNGLPDDPWYELKGSAFGKEGYERDFWVTYTRGADGNVSWEDKNGNTGKIVRNPSFHSQESYFPAWVKEDTYTLHGSLLPTNVRQDPSTGRWESMAYAWGYADNAGDDSVTLPGSHGPMQMNYFRIADAVDNDGNSVALSGIDFIKVQTGAMALMGELGELSTEVLGFFICE